jgi:hypothetical protein
MSGVVLFRPGNELLWLFRQGRVVIETPSEAIQHLPSGLIPEAHQPLTDDVSMQELFLNERVIQRAGGLSGLDAWLERKFECQWPHNEWHSKDFTVMRHAPAAFAFAGDVITNCVNKPLKDWQELPCRTW